MLSPTQSKLNNLIIHSLCFAGCLYQVFQILLIYLAYGISSDVVIYIPKYHRVHDLSYCVRYVDYFNFDRFFIDKNISFKFDINNPGQKLSKLSRIASVRELMQYTPQATDLIAKCSIIPPNSYQVKKFNASECLKKFVIYKFYLQEYICYHFHLKQYANELYLLRPLKFALTRQGALFTLQWKRTKKRKLTYRMKLAVHKQFADPVLGIGQAPEIVNHFNDRTNSNEFKTIFVTYFSLRVTRLPPPYTTRCGELQALGFTSESECFNRCIRKFTLTQFNMLPFSVSTVQEDNYTHISDNEIKTNSKALIEIESQCDDLCSSDDCEDELISTRIVTRSTDMSHFTIHYEIPREHVYTLTYVPLVSFTSFLVYIFSTIGTWLGVSILGISSFLMKWFQRKCINASTEVMESHTPVITRLLHRVRAIEASNKMSSNSFDSPANTLRLKIVKQKVGVLNDNIIFTAKRVNELIDILHSNTMIYDNLDECIN